MATYNLKETRILPSTTDEEGNTIPRRIEFAYVKQVEDITSQPHRGVFRADQLDKEFAIAADGTKRTGQQILDDAGVSL